VFLWRQSASALAAALLLFGSVGLYLRQVAWIGRTGTAAFLSAFFGSALLLAWEWVDVFVLRSLALHAPSALDTLEGVDALSLYDLGALIPVGLFAIGWLWFAAVTLRARLLRRAPHGASSPDSSLRRSSRPSSARGAPASGTPSSGLGPHGWASRHGR